MLSRQAILDRQRAWAAASGHEPDERGYLATVDANLRLALSDAAQRAFARGPAELRALHSSSALAANVFDHWSDRDRCILAEALYLTGPLSAPRFAAQLTAAPDGSPLTVDVVFDTAGGGIVAVESRFTEWLSPDASTERPLTDAYFPEGDGLWNAKGLPACQALAQDVRRGLAPFRHLDAPQLLKHALGLATCRGRGFVLCYLYFDWPCAEGERHRSEIDAFRDAVGHELRFRALSYQRLFARLSASISGDSEDYLHWLKRRYFDAPLFS